MYGPRVELEGPAMHAAQARLTDWAMIGRSDSSDVCLAMVMPMLLRQVGRGSRAVESVCQISAE